jgi:flagellar hook-length control protein FliK
VLQVASDLSIHAHSNTLRETRSAPQPDRAPSPFESLLDESAQPAEPGPADDRGPRPDSPNHAPPAKAADSKQAPANENSSATKPEDAGPNDRIDVDKACIKSTASTQVIDANAGEGTVKTAADDKPAEPQKDSPACDQPDCGTQENPLIDVIAFASTPAPPAADHDRQVVTLPDQAAPAAEIATQSKPIDLGLLKTVVGKQADEKQVDGKKRPDTAAQADSDQVANATDDGATLAPKMVPPPNTEGKSQPTTGAGEQHARGELAIDGNRADPNAPAAPPADVNVTGSKAIPDNGATTVSTQPHSLSTAAASPALPSQPGPQPARVPLAGLAIEIAGKALAGKNRFEIRLDPPELGRIEVRLDVDRDGNVTSRLTVDRVETFDLLRRDAAGLERATPGSRPPTTDCSSHCATSRPRVEAPYRMRSTGQRLRAISPPFCNF